jgi:single-strand DNA-binding protein
MNKVILLGNLAKDIELRHTGAGTAVANTSIATNRKFKGANGDTREEVMFVDVTFFGRVAEIANQYLSKGSKVLVEGRLVLEQWTDQSGGKRSKHSVTVENLQMLDGKGEQGGGQAAPAQSKPGQAGAQKEEEPPADAPAPELPEIDVDNDDEEIPF